MMESRFGKQVHPLYERLIVFLQMLVQQQFITWKK